MADFGYGTRIGLLEKPEIRYIIDILHMHELKLSIYEQWPALSKLGFGKIVSRITPKISPTAQRFSDWYQNFTQNAIRNNRDSRRGIFAPVVEGFEKETPDSRHTKEQMLAEGSFTLFTGKHHKGLRRIAISDPQLPASEGNAIILSALQYYISRDVRVYERLQAEIRGKFTADETITWGIGLTSCEYLRACIDETLRLLPPASSVHWRESEREGIIISGQAIPQGCDIGVSLHTLFRSPAIFRNANQFWPERWIKGVLPDDEHSRARKTLKPFSIGPRACAGQTVAIMILSISLANLVNKFDFELATEPFGAKGTDASDHWLDNKDGGELQYESHFTASWKQGPFLHFRKRTA